MSLADTDHERRWRRIALHALHALIGLSFVTTLALVSTAAYRRLAPESSPVARGAIHAATHPCEHNACGDKLQQTSQSCGDLAAGVSCSDVAAFWRASQLKIDFKSRLQYAPDNRLLQGERLARGYHCFSCHGELGQGGLNNDGALKGYVPGYFGRDFRYLTQDARPEVVREWISTGTSTALTDHPTTGLIATFFLQRQAISMPSFSSLPATEVELLVEYVTALNLLGPLDVRGVEIYAGLTALPQRDPRLRSLMRQSKAARDTVRNQTGRGARLESLLQAGRKSSDTINTPTTSDNSTQWSNHANTPTYQFSESTR